MRVKIRLIGFLPVVAVSLGVFYMSGWGGLGGYYEFLDQQRNDAGDSNRTDSGTNLFRRACDWAARKGGIVAGAPHVQFGCGPYWDDQEEYDPPEATTEEPPFLGGQCSGVAYEATFNYEVNAPGQTTAPRIETLGPRIGPITEYSIEILSEPSGPGFSGQARFRLRDFQGNSSTDVVNFAFGTTPERGELSRVDGQPDNCGDLPSEPRYPDPRPVPPEILPPDGTPVPIGDPNDPDDNPPDIIFPPEDTPYDPWIPIVNPPPGFPPFVFPPQGGDDIPPRTGEPIDVPGGGTGGSDIEAPEPAIPSEECIGFAWDFYDIPENRGGIPDSEPARYYEIFGSAQLRIRGTGAAFYDSPVKIDSRTGVCYRSDRSLKVEALSLNSKLSFGPVRVTPIYVLREGKG